MPNRIVWIVALTFMGGFFQARACLADQVKVRYPEGMQHGFIVLRTPEGKRIAAGDLVQMVEGDRVTTKLSIKFRDGSVEEETTVFSQREKFQLVQYHIVQKGPAFKTALDATIDASTGQITGHYAENGGPRKELNEKMDLAPDLANGIVPILLENILESGAAANVSMVAFTPKPRLVKLALQPQGDDPVSIGGFPRKARHFTVKVELGAVAGVVAPLIGKQPPVLHLWILGGEAPVFLRSEGPLYSDGPVWRIEFIGPTWAAAPPARAADHPDR